MKLADLCKHTSASICRTCSHFPSHLRGSPTGAFLPRKKTSHVQCKLLNSRKFSFMIDCICTFSLSKMFFVESIVRQRLNPAIFTRFIRIKPIPCAGTCVLKVEFYGNYEGKKIFELLNGLVMDFNIFCDIIC